MSSQTPGRKGYIGEERDGAMLRPDVPDGRRGEGHRDRGVEIEPPGPRHLRRLRGRPTLNSTGASATKQRVLRSVLLFLLLFLYSALSLASIIIDEQWLAANGPSPYYLSRPGTTYLLDVDVTTPGTAFAITARNVTFDLGNRTVTYGDAAPIVVPNGDFETIGGWDLSDSDARFAEGTFVRPVSVYSGNRALRFDLPVSSQSIRTLTPIVLEPETTYSLSAMFCNLNYRSSGESVRLYVKLKDSTVKVEQNGITWRGFMYKTVAFTTGPSGESHLLVIGIEGADQSRGSVYVDDVRVQRTLHHGVVVGLPPWQAALAPDIAQHRKASDITIKNGTIRQGRASGDWSHGILVGALNNGIEISHLRIHVGGANARNIRFEEACSEIVIHDNTLISEVRTITSRDQTDGVMINTSPGGSGIEVYRNVLSGGPQSGIRLLQTRDRSLIYENTISLRGLYSNGFAVVVRNAEVWGNTVNCHTGDFACRGMMVLDDSYVHHNQINVRYFPENQEYNGCSLGGVYGIQSEGAQDSTVSHNVVTAYADECEAVAFRINDSWRPGKPWGNSVVFANEFRAVQVGRAAAYAFKPSNVDEAVALQFYQNTLATNSGLVLGRNVDGQALVRNTFVLSGGAETRGRLFVSTGASSAPVREMRFIDNQYGSPEAKEEFESGVWTTARGVVDEFSSHVVGWSVSVKVRDGAEPVAGATVTIVDNAMNKVYSGTTNSEGIVEAIVEEFRVEAGRKSVFSPFSFEVASSGRSLSKQVAVDEPMTVEFDFGSSGQLPGDDRVGRRP